MDTLTICYNMKVYCVFSFLLFDEAVVISTQIYHFQYKKKKKKEKSP